MKAKGFQVGPGAMGENILTRGLDLLALPRNTTLQFGGSAKVLVTGLRNPCRQLDDHQLGLFAAVLDRDANGEPIRKAGIMGVVLCGGPICPDDAVRIELPSAPHQKLQPV